MIGNFWTIFPRKEFEKPKRIIINMLIKRSTIVQIWTLFVGSLRKLLTNIDKMIKGNMLILNDNSSIERLFEPKKTWLPISFFGNKKKKSKKTFIKSKKLRNWIGSKSLGKFETNTQAE